MDNTAPVTLNRVYSRYLSINYFYLLYLSGLILLHLFSIRSVGLAQTLSVFESLIVLLFLVQGKLSMTVLSLGIFILTSYDSKFFFAKPVGIEEVYNITFLPVVSVYLYLFLSFVIFALTLRRIIKKKIKPNNALVKFAIYTAIIMIPTGLVSSLSDGISYLSFTRDIKNNIVPALWTISLFGLFYTNKKLLLQYERLIIHVLLAYVIVGILTSSMGFFLERGDRTTLLYLPLASFFFTAIILFFYEIPQKIDKVFIGIMFVFTVFFQLFYDNCLGGKSWFVFLTVFVVGLYYIARRIVGKGVVVIAITTLLILIVVGILSSRVSSYINNSDNGKLLEFVSLFEGVQSGNLDDVENSAQFRFLESITISEYYLDHPQYLLLGKGIGGGVPNAGYFVYSETAFTEDQYQKNNFSTMHETFNVIFLKCGLIGILFLFFVLYDAIKNIKYDPLFYIGCIWLLFYWSYSINLLFLGLPAFLIAYQKLEMRNCPNTNRIK